MTSERIEELMKQTAYPESNSVFQAMNQVWNEMQQDFNSRTCENCKYWYVVGIGGVKCNNIMSPCVHSPKDFGCNKFEAKNVSTD